MATNFVHIFFRAVLVAALIWGLAGCATMSQDECRAANWYEIGKKDASQGYALARLGEHRESCAEFGIAPSVEGYRAGYTHGLSFYCNANRGWTEGLNGQSYRNVCPPEMERDFLLGYRAGQEIHDLEQQLDEIDHSMDRVEEKLDEPGLSDKRIQELRRELRNLTRDARGVERELADAKAEARHRGFYQ